jgi:hypothetical protein
VVKTLKHGLIIFSATAKHAQDWDEHLPRILFGYICGVHVSIRFPPHMISTRHTSKLWVDNLLNPLAKTYDVDADPMKLAE